MRGSLMGRFTKRCSSKPEASTVDACTYGKYRSILGASPKSLGEEMHACQAGWFAKMSELQHIAWFQDSFIYSNTSYRWIAKLEQRVDGIDRDAVG